MDTSLTTLNTNVGGYPTSYKTLITLPSDNTCYIIPYTNCNDTVKTGFTPFIKGYSWDKIKNTRLSGETNNVCVATTTTSISGQLQNVLVSGKVTDNNKCRVWSRDFDYLYIKDRDDFRYLN